MKKVMSSFVFAFKGLVYAFKTQLNFKIHCVFAILALALGFYVKLNPTEWLWISFAIAAVLVLELLNTAIEVLVDLVSPARNDKAGAIKDLAAAAVLVTSLLAIVIGLFIFVPKFI
jgi:diacylglycerol kinase